MTRSLSRRKFMSGLAALCGSAASAVEPLNAYAQQPASTRRIGVLLISAAMDNDVQFFRKGLRDAGYSEGHDTTIEWRFANGNYDRIPELVDDLIRHKVEVIVVETTRAVEVLKRSTSTIPIVMALVADPLGSGLVTSFAHPGGNVTGLSLMVAELGAKRMELFKEACPRLTHLAVLQNPDTPWHPKAITELNAAAPGLGLKLSFVGARTPDEFRSGKSLKFSRNTLRVVHD